MSVASARVQAPETTTKGVSTELLSKGLESLTINDDQTLPAPQPHRNDVVNKWKLRTTIVVTACATGLNAMLAGLITVVLPAVAAEFDLGADLLLWPISVYAMTCGCTLLLMGTMADAIGNKPIYLMGCLLQTCFTLACGLSKTGAQLIIFRGFGGFASSFILPSAVSITSATYPEGRKKNLAFAMLGGSQPIGFSVGLLLGGICASTIGWRWGFYIASMISGGVLLLAFLVLPTMEKVRPDLWKHFRHEIDWIGIVIGSASIALILYALTTITDRTSNITRPATLTTLISSIALLITFVLWVGRQERLSKPAIIPNSLWRSRTFTCVCLGLFLTWGAATASDAYQSLFFQHVQTVSALQTSLRFLPGVISGAITTLIIGFVVHKLHMGRAISLALLSTAAGILLMAIIRRDWPYWACAFPAVILIPIGADALYTISNLVIISQFPKQTQALAGSVLNTIAQIAKSISLATSAAIAASVTTDTSYEWKESPMALLEGYKAAFWYLFSLVCVTILLFLWGLRSVSKLDAKEE